MSNLAVEFWKDYRLKVYGENKPLRQTQERECSMAFYAGMAIAFKAVFELSKKEDVGTDALEKLRKEIEYAAMHANLNRSTGQS